MAGPARHRDAACDPRGHRRRALRSGVFAEGYWHFMLALVALTTITGVGLNILLGLTGQVSLGHVGFYSIGAYTAAILTLKGVSFWIAFPIAGLVAGVGRRAAGVAGLARDRALSRDGDHRLRLHRGARNHRVARPDRRPERPDGDHAAVDRLVHASPSATSRSWRSAAPGLALYFFHRLADSAWGKGMVAVRDAEVAARSIGLNPVDREDRGFRAVGGADRTCGRDVRAAPDVRRTIQASRSRNRSCFCLPSLSAAPAGRSAP